MTIYTESGMERREKIRIDSNPLVSGREWAKGRYHPNKSEKEPLAVSRSRDVLAHQSIEANTVYLYLNTDPIDLE